MQNPIDINNVTEALETARNASTTNLLYQSVDLDYIASVVNKSARVLNLVYEHIKLFSQIVDYLMVNNNQTLFQADFNAGKTSTQTILEVLPIALSMSNVSSFEYFGQEVAVLVRNLECNQIVGLMDIEKNGNLYFEEYDESTEYKIRSSVVVPAAQNCVTGGNRVMLMLFRSGKFHLGPRRYLTTDKKGSLVETNPSNAIVTKNLCVSQLTKRFNFPVVSAMMVQGSGSSSHTEDISMVNVQFDLSEYAPLLHSLRMLVPFDVSVAEWNPDEECKFKMISKTSLLGSCPSKRNSRGISVLDDGPLNSPLTCNNGLKVSNLVLGSVSLTCLISVLIVLLLSRFIPKTSSSITSGSHVDGVSSLYPLTQIFSNNKYRLTPVPSNIHEVNRLPDPNQPACSNDHAYQFMLARNAVKTLLWKFSNGPRWYLLECKEYHYWEEAKILMLIVFFVCTTIFAFRENESKGCMATAAIGYTAIMWYFVICLMMAVKELIRYDHLTSVMQRRNREEHVDENEGEKDGLTMIGRIIIFSVTCILCILILIMNIVFLEKDSLFETNDGVCWVNPSKTQMTLMLPIGILVIFDCLYIFACFYYWMRYVRDSNPSSPTRSRLPEVVAKLVNSLTLGLPWVSLYCTLGTPRITAWDYIFTVTTGILGIICIIDYYFRAAREYHDNPGWGGNSTTPSILITRDRERNHVPNSDNSTNSVL